MDFRKRLIGCTLVVALAAGTAYIGYRAVPITEIKETDDSSLFSMDKNSLYLWYTDEHLSAYLDSMAVAYNAEHENVRVIPELQTGSEFLESIHQASVEADHFPDLYIASNDALGKATLAGLASEIEVPENVALETLFPETALQAVTYHNKQMGYPLSYVTSSLVYNETYLEEWAKAQMEAEIDQAMAEEAQAQADAGNVEEGATLDQDAAAALVEKEVAKQAEAEQAESTEEVEEVEDVLSPEEQFEVDRRVEEAIPRTFEDILTFADSYDAPEQVEGVLKWDVTDIFYNYFVVGDSIEIGGISGDNLEQIDLYTEDAIKSLSLYQDLNQFFSIETDAISYDGVVQDFIDGKILYMIATPDCLSTIEMAKEEGLFPYEYGVALLPDTSENLQAKSLSVTTAVVVNGYSAKQKEANDFAAFLATADGNELYRRTGKVSALLSVPYETPCVGEFMQEYQRSAPVAKMIETNNYWIKLEVAFAKIWEGDDPNQILKILSEEIMTQVTGEDFTEELITLPQEIEEELEEDTGMDEI